MGVFVIISKNPPAVKLQGLIENKFRNNYYLLSPGNWLVSSEGTVKEITEVLGITDKENGPGSAAVFSISSYWGLYSTDLWDWLKAKLESSSG